MRYLLLLLLFGCSKPKYKVGDCLLFNDKPNSFAIVYQIDGNSYIMDFGNSTYLNINKEYVEKNSVKVKGSFCENTSRI